MTVLSTTTRVVYAGAGTTGPFPVPFYFLDAADLTVVRRNADGTETDFVLGSSHSVTGAGNPAGGAVTTTAAVPVGATLVIFRDPPIIQDAAYVDHARFPAPSHERALDKGRMIERRTREMVERTPQLADTDIDGNGAYQARGNRITNIGAPSDNTDAARLLDLVSVRDTLLALLAITGVQTPFFGVRGAVALVTVSPGTLALQVGGVVVPGDARGARLYKRVDAQPAHLGRVRSLDRYKSDGTTDNSNGGWWSLAEMNPRPQDFGGFGGNPVLNDGAAFQAAFGYLAAGGTIEVPPAIYYFTDATLPVTWINEGFVLAGMGSGMDSTTRGTILKSTSVTQPLLKVNNGDGGVIRNLSMQGTIGVVPDASNSSPHLLEVASGTAGGYSGTYGFYLEDVQIDTAWCGIKLVDGFYTRMNKVRIKNIWGPYCVYSSGSTNANDRNDDHEMVQVQLAGASKTTDNFVHEGYGGSHKFVECSFVFGRHGIVVNAIPGAAAEPGFFYFVGGGMENGEGNCIRARAGNHWMIGDAYFSQDGDADTMRFERHPSISDDTDGAPSNIQITGCYIRGAGRSGIYCDGHNLTIEGGAIYNGGRYARHVSPSGDTGHYYDQRDIVSITDGAPLGGVRIVLAAPYSGVNVRQQPFVTGEWIYIVGNGGGMLGPYRINATGAANTHDLFKLSTTDPTGTERLIYDPAFAAGALGYARIMASGIHIGPNAKKTSLSPGQIGKSIDGLENFDWAIFCESSGEIKISEDIVAVDGTLGRFKYVPNVAPFDCNKWVEKYRGSLWKEAGATATGYSTSRLLTAGTYALVGIELKCSAGAPIVRAVAHRTASGYDESSSVTATTSWAFTRFSSPVVVKVGELHDEIGYRVVTAASGADLQVKPVWVRIC